MSQLIPTAREVCTSATYAELARLLLARAKAREAAEPEPIGEILPTVTADIISRVEARATREGQA